MISLPSPVRINNMNSLLSMPGYSGWLPKAKRNYGSTIYHDGTAMRISRTGYTGEVVAMEIRVDSKKAPKVVEDLAAAGRPYNLMFAGLASRDGARTEAGLPLYGHEISDELLIHSVTQAKFGVNLADPTRKFIGRGALEVQRRDFERIERGESVTLDDLVLKRMIRSLVVPSGERSLRAGMKLYYEGKEVGVVTTGLYAPYSHFEGEGVYSKPADSWDSSMKRSVGMALIDSNIRFDPTKEIIFQVGDKDKIIAGLDARLTDTNLLGGVPYSRPSFGPLAEPRRVPVYPGTISDLGDALVHDAVANTRWRQFETLNFTASENTISPAVRALMTLDPSHRYNEHSIVRALGEDFAYYQGTDFMMKGSPEGSLGAGVEELLLAQLRANTGAANVIGIINSGTINNHMVFGGTKDYVNRKRIRPRGLVAISVALNDGGHISSQASLGLKDYLEHDEHGMPKWYNIPMRRDSPYD